MYRQENTIKKGIIKKQMIAMIFSMTSSAHKDISWKIPTELIIWSILDLNTQIQILNIFKQYFADIFGLTFVVS